jgi:hypothetical protein
MDDGQGHVTPPAVVRLLMLGVLLVVGAKRTPNTQAYYFKWKVIHSSNTNSKVEARLNVRFSFHESLKSL